jgi:predicted permease
VILPVYAIKRYDPTGRVLENPGQFSFSALVRLKPGNSMESVRPVLRDLWPHLEQFESQSGSDNFRQKLEIEPGGYGVSRVRSEFSQALVVLMALVALVLLITCANVANLLIAAAATRRKETAMRLAIGANRPRLIRQSLTESAVLAAAGGLTGVLLAGWIARLLLLFLPPGEAGFLEFRLDVRMLLFAGVVTAGTALLFGLLPALQSVRVPLNAALSEGGRTPGTGRRSWLARAVMVAQVSICLVLVITALLFARSLGNISAANLGFQRDNLLLVDLGLGRAGIRGEQNDLVYKRLLDELNNTPGILSASCSRVTPLSGSQWWDPAVVPGYVPEPNEMTTIYMNQVSPRYFRTMGIPILEGRDFTPADDQNSRRVAIVSQSFARRFFGGRPAMGRIISTATGASNPQVERYAIFRDLQIVGIAADARYSDPRETPKDVVYLAAYQAGLFDITGAVEVRLAPGAGPDQASARIRSIVNRVAEGVEADVRPFDTLFARSLQRDRMVAVLSGAFGALGTALACIGLYGVMSQAVSARTGEIGIRMALGARGPQIEWMVLRETLWLVALGAAVGVPLAVASGRFAGGLLFGLGSADPVALAGSLAVMTGVSLAATWLPARRSARIDPLRALRQE